jgi:hypothetical protein
MAWKYWARDNGKSIYHGPEEEMYKQMEDDPNCVEIPEDRPEPYMDWSPDGWVENPVAKEVYLNAEADRALEEAKPYYFIEMADPKEEADRKKYLREVAEVKLGQRQNLPEKPNFIVATSKGQNRKNL